MTYDTLWSLPQGNSLLPTNSFFSPFFRFIPAYFLVPIFQTFFSKKASMVCLFHVFVYTIVNLDKNIFKLTILIESYNCIVRVVNFPGNPVKAHGFSGSVKGCIFGSQFNRLIRPEHKVFDCFQIGV